MTRIRYNKMPNGNKISPKYLAGQKLVWVVLFPSQSRFEINSNEGTEYTSIVYSRPGLILKDAKECLKKLGVVIFDEVRNK